MMDLKFSTYFRLDISVIYDAAVELHKAGKYEEAKDKYIKVLELKPTHYNANNNIACALDDLGYPPEKCLSYLNKAKKLEPNNYMAYYNAGYILERRMQKYDLAAEEYSKAIKRNPFYISSYENRSACYIQLEKHDAAVDDVRNTIMLRYPEYDPLKLVTLVEKDQFRKGIIAIEKLVNAGFIPDVIGDLNVFVIIKPEKSSHKVILPTNNIHVSKTNKRFLRQYEGRYELKMDADFESVMARLEFYYQKKSPIYMEQLRHFYPLINQYAKKIQFISVSLFVDRNLAAGELGILSKKTYVSLTGFHDMPSAGSVQLILLARELEKRGVKFLDFGASTDRWDTYKIQLGAKKYTTEEYQNMLKSVQLRYLKRKKIRRKNGTV